jgi:peptidoglycan/xylan/chitin deacetylase (PgdA/CDA1 family)
MAPSRRAFLAAAAAALTAACTDQGTGPDAPAGTPLTRPVSSTTLAPAGPVAATTGQATGPGTRPARVVVAGPRTSHQVALTFHLSGDPALVARLLDTTSQAGVPISLFAVGRWLTDHPTLVRRILADGHELDNHTWSHPVLGRLTGPAVAAEIRRCRAALIRATGSGGRYFRPSGMTRPTPLVLAEAAAAGYPLVVAFDVDPHDYTDPGADAVTARVAAGLRPGSIVSLHTGHAGTIAALPAILATTRTHGLHPVPLHRLLVGRPSPP